MEIMLAYSHSYCISVCIHIYKSKQPYNNSLVIIRRANIIIISYYIRVRVSVCVTHSTYNVMRLIPSTCARLAHRQ